MIDLNAVAKHAMDNGYTVIDLVEFEHDYIKAQKVDEDINSQFDYIAYIAQIDSINRMTFEFKRPDGSTKRKDFNR